MLAAAWLILGLLVVSLPVALADTVPRLEDATAFDLDGRAMRLPAGASDINVLVFVDTLCPISNRYAPDLGRLASQHAGASVHVWMVYPNVRLAADEVRKHMAEYALPGTALLDRAHALVQVAEVSVTPESAVFRAGERLYHGRVDDRFTGFGTQRARARVRNLDDAIGAARDGRAPAKAHEPFVGAGCFIADLGNGGHDHGTAAHKH